MTRAAPGRTAKARCRALVVALAVASVALGGCPARERICSSGMYPVKAVGNKTGRTCVPDGNQPPAGYVRYPAGKVPKYVDDEWDRYWRTVVVDENGTVVSG
jgi:hypothetical protein